MRVRMAKTFSMRRVSVGASLKRCVGQAVVRWGKHHVALAAKRGAHDVELSQIVAAPMQHVRRARARLCARSEGGRVGACAWRAG